MEIIMKYGMEILFSLVSAGLLFLWKRVKRYYQDLKITRDSVAILLKMNIVEKYHHYKRDGSLPLFDKEAVEEMYQRYHSLGGMGVVEDLVHEIQSVPSKKCTGGE